MRVFKSVGLCISVGRFLLPKCERVFSLNMSRGASGNVCVCVCLQMSAGRLLLEHCADLLSLVFTQMLPEKLVIACLCRIFFRLDMKDSKVCHF